MSERKCPECGGEMELLVKIRENRDRFVSLFHCTNCGRVYSGVAFKQKI
jgi:uncharacterized Zn finger protein